MVSRDAGKNQGRRLRVSLMQKTTRRATQERFRSSCGKAQDFNYGTEGKAVLQGGLKKPIADPELHERYLTFGGRRKEEKEGERF